MVSEFHLLSEKIGQLAELARSLRRENADLRLAMVELATEKEAISRRMQEAHERVATLLAKLPAAHSDQEAA
jgi:FtsZ-binding cell division protein ZapB